MDTHRFDVFTRALSAVLPSRRVMLRMLGGGAAALTLGAAPEAGAKRRRRKKKCKGGCDANQVCRKGRCQAAPNRCSGIAVCDTEPTPCGTTAGGGNCSCERTAEGNTACINFIETCADFPHECRTTEDCRASAGLHFFCQEVKGCGCTKTARRCMPECDNPD